MAHCVTVAGLSRELRFLAIRLRPYRDAETIREHAEALRVVLLEREDRWQQAIEERVAATAEIVYRDGVVDTIIAALARDLLTSVDGDRNHLKYRNLLPIAPSVAMVSVGSDFQTRFVKNILSVLRDDLAYINFGGTIERLSVAQLALDHAVATRTELGIPEARAHIDRQIAVDDVRRFLSLARAQLSLIFPNDEGLVHSFFAPRERTALKPTGDFEGGMRSEDDEDE